MEVAKVITARAIRLFDLEELNPQGRSLLPVVYAIARKYKFLHGPGKLEEIEIGKGFKFSDGVFRARDIDIAVHLEIYQDGIVATTQSTTADADALIDDLLSWVTTEYGIGNQVYILKAKRTYRSELVVFAPEIQLGHASEKLNQVAAGIPGIEGDRIQLIGVILGGDSPKNRPMFTFERRLNVPFDEHKYFTSALMPTDTHLEVITQLAKLLS